MTHRTTAPERPATGPHGLDRPSAGNAATDADPDTLAAAAVVARAELENVIEIAEHIRTLNAHCMVHATDTPTGCASEQGGEGLLGHVNEVVAMQTGIGAMIDVLGRHADRAHRAFGHLV